MSVRYNLRILEKFSHIIRVVLSNCRNHLKQIPNKRVIHSYHEANQCADALAKLEAQYFTHFVVFCNPPPVVETLFAFDKASMYCNRLVNSYFDIISWFTQKKKEKRVVLGLKTILKGQVGS